jgi:hypothetical protein
MPSSTRYGRSLALLLALAPASAVAQEAAQEPERTLLGPPLIVDGERIERDALRRHLIHAVGAHVMERVRLRWMVEAELTERAHRHAVHAGEPRGRTAKSPTFERTYAELLSALDITDEELDKEVDYQSSLQHRRHDGLDSDAAMRREHDTLAEFREHVRATMLFDRVFLPDDPEEWPKVTVEAFLADPGGGRILVDDARESYATRLRLGEEYGDDPPRDDESLRRIYRGILHRSMTSWLDIRTAVDGLELPLVATVDFDADGRPEEEVTVYDLWPAVLPLVDDEDVVLARNWLATVAATRSQLLESGFGPERELRLLARKSLRPPDDGRFAPAWEEEFPSAAVYHEYAWLREGVRRRLRRDLTALSDGGRPTPRLEDAVWRVRATAGRAEVDAELILLAAWDDETATWNDDGWACARERADELADSLRHEVRIHELQVRRFRQVTVPAPVVLWSHALDKHSEFWEPPQSRTARSSEAMHKGRVGPRSFDDLRTLLRVSNYRRFALGGSLADDVQFHLPIGEIVGPLRGPLGYYLVRIRDRKPPRRDVDPATWLEAVLDEATLDYSREALEAAEVSGLD